MSPAAQRTAARHPQCANRMLRLNRRAVRSARPKAGLARMKLRSRASFAFALAAVASLPVAAGAAPSSTQALVDQAATSLMRGDAAQAAATYTDALKDTSLPNDRRASILTDRGVAYTRLNQAKLAIDDFNKAAQLFPEYAAVYNNRGNLLLALG